MWGLFIDTIFIYRYIIPVTPNNPVQCIFWHHESVPSSVFVVRPSLDKWALIRKIVWRTCKLLIINLQINYLIDEAVNTGKGANTISLLQHFFSTHSLGEANLHLHADNCSGQNKNRYVMQYLVWRVLVGLNDNITLSFLIVGHTKFSPDWCFGLLKQAYRRRKIGCLDDIVHAIEESAVVNHAQLVGRQDGTVVVPTYDWAAFFDEPFRQRALQGIKSMHHLRFTCEKPDSVLVRDTSDSPEREINLVKEKDWKPAVDDLPAVIPPPGLSLERRQYLFEKIREFCPPECQVWKAILRIQYTLDHFDMMLFNSLQDLVCPDPGQADLTPSTPKRRRRQIYNLPVV